MSKSSSQLSVSSSGTVACSRTGASATTPGVRDALDAPPEPDDSVELEDTDGTMNGGSAGASSGEPIPTLNAPRLGRETRGAACLLVRDGDLRASFHSRTLDTASS